METDIEKNIVLYITLNPLQRTLKLNDQKKLLGYIFSTEEFLSRLTCTEQECCRSAHLFRFILQLKNNANKQETFKLIETQLLTRGGGLITNVWQDSPDLSTHLKFLEDNKDAIEAVMLEQKKLKEIYSSDSDDD